MRAIILPFVVAVLLTSGCAHMTIQREEKQQPVGPVQRIALSSFLWGFVPAQALPNENQLCPQSRLQTLDLKMETSDVLLTMVTLGIYVPYRIDLMCLSVPSS